jgi:hypothetical protein
VTAVALTMVLAASTTALATHRFDDVADDHPHAAGINWAASSGVTRGCADGSNFCPDQAVTRAEMATFMARLAGQGTSPSVNADKVDGLDADQLRGSAGPPGPPGPGGFGEFYSANTFTVTADGCPTGEYRAVQARRWVADLDWGASPCGAPSTFTGVTWSGTIPYSAALPNEVVFTTDSHERLRAGGDYVRCLGHTVNSITCMAVVDGDTNDFAAFSATAPESAPAVLYLLP